MVISSKKDSLRQLIRLILLEQQNQSQKGYLLKNQLVQLIQTEVQASLAGSEETSGEEYAAVVRDAVSKVKSDIDLTCSAIERYLLEGQPNFLMVEEGSVSSKKR